MSDNTNAVDAEKARDVMPEIAGRAGFLVKVGLGYLGLDRSVRTLSSGESRRVRLASQLEEAPATVGCWRRASVFSLLYSNLPSSHIQ